MRSMPDGSYDTADALVFFVKNSTCANNCREALLREGLGTKILPEAYSWHFASTWNHMPELVEGREGDLSNRFSKSHAILSTAVALPVSVNLPIDTPEKPEKALSSVLMAD